MGTESSMQLVECVDTMGSRVAGHTGAQALL